MSFPTTSALDNFNRANENPLSGGGNWSISGTFNAPFQLFSNGVFGTSGSKFNEMSYSAAGDLTDCEVFATIVTVPAAGNTIGVVARQDPSTDTGKNYYDCLYIAGTGIRIRYFDSTGAIAILATYAQTVSVGDAIGLSVIGTTLTAYYKASGGSWVTLGSVTDTNLTHGYIGITGFPLVSGGKLDDFGGGAVAVVDLDSDIVAGVTTISFIDENPDIATVIGVSTPSSAEESDQYDSDTIVSRTSLSATEVTTTETLVVTEVSTGLDVGDTVDFVVSSTTTTTTSTTDTPPPPPTDIVYGVSISTTDYNNQSWIVAYSYNSGAAITAGTVASFDGDDGLLEVAGGAF